MRQAIFIIISSFILIIFTPIVVYANDIDKSDFIALFDYDKFIVDSNNNIKNGYRINVQESNIPCIQTGTNGGSYYYDRVCDISINSTRCFYLLEDTNYYWGKGIYLGSNLNRYYLKYIYFSGNNTYTSGFNAVGITNWSGNLINAIPLNSLSNMNLVQGISFPFVNSQGNSVSNPYVIPYWNMEDINIPVFSSDDDAKLFYETGDISLIKNTIDNGWLGLSNINIGHIKNTSYKLDNTSILQSPSNFREYVSWDSVKSSSGYEYSNNDKVKFFIKDRSYKTRINNIGPGEVIDQVVNQLQKWVYPKGSAKNMLASGEAIKTSSYGNMVYVGEQLATLGNFSFNSLSKMQNLSDSDMQNYLSQVTGGTGTYSWMTKVSNWVSGNSINVNVAYDIYCYIQSGSKNGDWYRINFHDTPVPQRGDRVNGGITASPVVPFNPFTPDETGDWFNAPEFDDKDDDDEQDGNNKDDNGLSVYYYTDDGDTYITNNYTYNYDNRSWVENHFDNNTIEEVNEGFEWIKLFGGIFSIFLTLFGAFLPGWAVTVVSISIPIIIGLILFKVIKGVVPFV